MGGSLVLSLPFLLSLCSLGLILNFRLGVEPVLQPQPPDITQNREGRGCEGWREGGVLWTILWTGRGSGTTAREGEKRLCVWWWRGVCVCLCVSVCVRACTRASERVREKKREGMGVFCCQCFSCFHSEFSCSPAPLERLFKLQLMNSAVSAAASASAGARSSPSKARGVCVCECV